MKFTENKSAKKCDFEEVALYFASKAKKKSTFFINFS